jgi:hypothetical protein
MAIKKRVKITEEVEAEVIFRSDRLCCCCNNGKKMADQIHHINGDNTNSKFENLAYLCFDCHSAAEVKGGLKKRLTPKAIIKYRDLHYEIVSKRRSTSLKILDNPISQLSSEVLLVAAKNAIIILEIANIKEQLFESNWDKGISLIGKLFKYVDHSNKRISYEVFSFLLDVAAHTRSQMPYSISSSIFHLVLNFYPISYFKLKDKQSIEIGNQCISISFNLIYDSAIHLKNISITEQGLLILKYIYINSKQNKKTSLVKNVIETFNKIESHLERPERDDLINTKELVKIFKNSLDDAESDMPDIPNYLYQDIKAARAASLK